MVGAYHRRIDCRRVPDHNHHHHARGVIDSGEYGSQRPIIICAFDMGLVDLFYRGDLVCLWRVVGHLSRRHPVDFFFDKRIRSLVPFLVLLLATLRHTHLITSSHLLLRPLVLFILSAFLATDPHATTSSSILGLSPSSSVDRWRFLFSSDRLLPASLDRHYFRTPLGVTLFSPLLFIHSRLGRAVFSGLVQGRPSITPSSPCAVAQAWTSPCGSVPVISYLLWT